MSAAIQGIYIALFGRPADPGGLAYWTEVTKGGADLSAMLSVLPNLTEYTTRFEGQTPDQVITTVYQNLFGRAPDPEGLAFFKGQLASGAQTLATIAVNIMQGAQGDDKADVTAKVGAAELFTASLDTPEEIAAYQGADAAALAKKFLDTVDKDKPATPESVEKAAGAVVAGQDPTGGQAPNPGGGGTGGTPGPVDGVGNSASDATLSATASLSSNMHAGTGISNGNFEVTTTSLSQIEIALKGYKRSEGDAPNSAHTYTLDGNDKAGFAYSVASLGGKSIEQLMADGYSFHLKIDNDKGAGFGANSANLTLQKLSNSGDASARDSGYNWVSDANSAIQIRDDQGTASVTQNVQSPIWYGAQGRADGSLLAGSYSASLEVRKGGSVVATETIELKVSPSVTKDTIDGVLSSVALNGSEMINGDGNAGNHFSIVHVANELEIALGAQVRHGATKDPNDSGILTFDAAEIPTFKFSVAALGATNLEGLLNKYDIRLLVDNDKSSKVNFLEFTAGKTNGQGEANSPDVGALDWLFGQTPVVRDDQGNANVSQNIQALSWYLGNTNPVAVDAGDYTIALAVYDRADLTNLVGYSSILIHVASDMQ